ncbi:hypothetical protein J5N97_022440 [Dioscorea zingiberensis]|uniref:Uncharacterized protein n=1 Tax=Dioscorea zingiberensis TaxID=325984 RepID=A0A9D5CB76_9LILI|nr:hypothetical protein J5N97_022440 [Dioscorea zingiberensis]
MTIPATWRALALVVVAQEAERVKFIVEKAEQDKKIKIGRPGYRVTKQFDPGTKKRSLLFQVTTIFKGFK